MSAGELKRKDIAHVAKAITEERYRLAAKAMKGGQIGLSMDEDIGLALARVAIGAWNARTPRPEQPADGGWRSIATAPRDGCWVVLADQRSVVVGWWDGETWRVDASSVFSRPTHWQHLPAPPTGKAAP